MIYVIVEFKFLRKFDRNITYFLNDFTLNYHYIFLVFCETLVVK